MDIKRFLKLYDKPIHVYKRKLFASFFVLLSFLTLISTLIIFYLFSQSATRDIIKSNEFKISQANDNITQIIDEIFVVSNHLLSEKYIKHTVLDKSCDKILQYQTSLKLSALLSVYSFIDSIGIYSSAANVYFDSKGKTSNTNHYNIINYINNTIDQGDQRIYFSYITSNNEMNKELNNISFIFYLYSSRIYYGSIVINVSENIFISSLQPLINSKDELFIVDRDENVICKSDSDLVMAALDSIYVKDILHSEKDLDSFMGKINGDKTLISFTKIDVLDWYIVVLQEYSNIFIDITNLRYKIITIIVILVAISFLISIKLADNIYKPLNRLVAQIRITDAQTIDNLSQQQLDEFEYLSNTYTSIIDNADKYEAIMQNICLKSIFDGKTKQFTNITKSMQFLDAYFDSPQYNVIIINIDMYLNDVIGESNKIQEDVRAKVLSLSRLILSERYRCRLIEMDDDQIAVLLHTTTKNTKDIKNCAFILQERVAWELNILLTIIIGDYANSKDDIYLSYESALHYSRYRFFMGYGAVIDSKDVEQYSKQNLKYPLAIEKKFLDDLRIGRLYDVKKDIESLLRYISLGSIEDAEFIIVRFILIIWCQLESTFSEKDFKNYLDNNKLIMEKGVINDLRQAIYQTVVDFYNVLEQKKRDQKYKIEKIIEKYIKENYNDANLNIDMVSDIVDLSPDYTRKVFKNMFGLSFGNYLNRVRMENARFLLINTKEPIKNISEKVGVDNLTYFYTLFRKNYGMTPGIYRNKNRKTNT